MIDYGEAGGDRILFRNCKQLLEKHRTRSLRSLLGRVLPLYTYPLDTAVAILDSITFSEISLLVTELGKKYTEPGGWRSLQTIVEVELKDTAELHQC